MSETRVVKISLPTLTFKLPTLPERIRNFPYLLEEFVSETWSHRPRFSASSLTSPWTKLSKPKKRFILLTIIILAITVIGLSQARRYLANRPQVSGTLTQSIQLNREFNFPLRGQDGAVTDTSLKYVVVSADLTDKIIIQGKQASAAAGRLFLILNLKLENPTQTALSIKTRDFVRITPDGSSDRLAPDIHNDPAEVQPISTKLTRVGFPVDATVRHFILYIGEINGEKQEIELNFT